MRSAGQREAEDVLPPGRSPVEHAAHKMASGRSLDALNAVALENGPTALALRAVAMAQFGEHALAIRLLRRAARGFGPGDVAARARCVVVEAEIALASRDLAWPRARLEHAAAVLNVAGDRANAVHAHHLKVRRLCLLGRLDDARREMDGLRIDDLPSILVASHRLIEAHIAARSSRVRDAERALAAAADAAVRADHPAVLADVAKVRELMERPAATLTSRGERQTATLRDIDALGDAIVVDAFRRTIRRGGACCSLARRPIQFGLARALAEAWPRSVPRHDLIALVFHDRTTDWNSRARLRVAIGRLRVALAEFVDIEATDEGYALKVRDKRPVFTLTPSVEQGDAGLLALLDDGAAWSSTALAIALNASQRTVQRSLEALVGQGRVCAIGRGRARRWVTRERSDFATWLLLPVMADAG